MFLIHQQDAQSLISNKQIGIEFHIDEKTQQIVGSFYNNSMIYEFNSLGSNAILDFVTVEITDEKFKLISTKNYIGKTIEFEYSEDGGSVDMGATIDGIKISISFANGKTATVMYSDETYQLEKDVQPDASQISPMFYRINPKYARQPVQKANMSFIDLFKQAIEPYKRYSYIIYTATFILFIEFIFICSGFCFKRNKYPENKEEQPEEKAVSKEDDSEKEEESNDEKGEKFSDGVDDDVEDDDDGDASH
ncbi:hypothetical protein TVAG_238690 [Trichomonas vaginalis G3]|uniref:Uncharacterized protein n=1 Tax=Trichomonas vaginalis (strain ATCC PRA-98 / G3) TaxID=412133 RepID=A2DGA1_TRIV3|nr:hypothetical protein TVAGG3_0967330 [Trichomonas vaginalis G3]EAY20497.1 hypothetical protein TVAG_238690 [Trichomonas vaginalis G3]KAI5488335.1 hypothetical protein TVAGG3_0967330 [Trichomonas vaginalis G3]|eukprot:XP_001581483.1 hypothetical protein [Trichomonas vaginalis G3]